MFVDGGNVWKKQIPQSPIELYARIQDVELLESLKARLNDTDYHNKVSSGGPGICMKSPYE